jgi:hypothetical protein
MYVCRLLGMASALFLSACGAVPPLAEDPIAIKEIVQRIKCEIWYAVPRGQGPWPTGDLQWLRDWTAKVDLTLETDDTGGIAPGISFVNPMRSVILPASGTFQQMFSFGLGGGLNTTASRVETLSFTLSFAELKNPYYLGICGPPQGLGLLGNLGLKEWMDAALAPARGENAELRIGYHAAPSSSAKAASPPKKEKSQAFDPIDQKIAELNDRLVSIDWYAKGASKYALSAKTLASKLRSDDLTKPPQQFYVEIQSVVDNAARTQDAIDKANNEIKAANTIQEDLNKYKDDARVPPALKKAADDIENAKKTISAAGKDAKTALGALPPNGPIDAIAHQVSFVVTLSGNVTPNWTLVRFRGPGTANNGFASASRAFTHSLNISMGSPADSTIGKVSTEQLRQLDILHQNAAFRNAIATQSAISGTPF